MKNENKGSRKAPRKSRKDINRDSQNSRVAELNEVAKAKGWGGLSEYLTAVRKGEAVIPQKRA